MRWLLAIIIVFLPLVAMATSTTTSTVVVTPESVDSVGGLFDVLKLSIKAFQGGAWAVGAGLVLTMVVAALRMFNVIKRIPKEYVPWGVAGMAMLTSVGLGLQAGIAWDAILTTGLTVGLVSMGGWSTFGKLAKGLLKKVWPKAHDKIFGSETPKETA